jgi:hypothetical protein
MLFCVQVMQSNYNESSWKEKKRKENFLMQQAKDVQTY